MNRIHHLRQMKRTYFEVWGNEQAQNSLLKGLLTGLSLLLLAETVCLCVLGLRKPVLIAIGNQKTDVLKITPPSKELLSDELRRTVSQYVLTHYNWDAATIEKAHAEAEKYVSDRFKQAFLSANAEQVKAAKEKGLKEIAYISQIEVNAKTLTAHVALDRILVVPSAGPSGGPSGQGEIRVTTPLTLEVHFEYGPRTEEDPEGIYVTSELKVDREKTADQK